MKWVWLLNFFLILPAQAFTFVHSSIRSGWDTKELTFMVNEASCTALGIPATVLNDAIDEAMYLWNSVPTSNLKLKRGGTTTSTAMSNPPTIWCTNSISDPETTAGIGGINAITSSGKPASGGLQINGDSTKGAYFGNMSVAKQQVIMAHEMGHVLGIGHSELDYALMYYSVSKKESARLSQDDADALSWLHPRKEPEDGVFGCGTISSGVGGSGGTGGAATFAMMLLMIGVGLRAMRSNRRVRPALA